MTVCFNCRNSSGYVKPDSGWVYTCSRGLDIIMSNNLEELLNCSESSPCVGFQIGGYWTHMWFEKEALSNSCLEWVICSDGEFPTQDKQPGMRFHLCMFEQMEKFVEFWRKELERRDWIKPRSQNENNM